MRSGAPSNPLRNARKFRLCVGMLRGAAAVSPPPSAAACQDGRRESTGLWQMREPEGGDRGIVGRDDAPGFPPASRPLPRLRVVRNGCGDQCGQGSSPFARPSAWREAICRKPQSIPALGLTLAGYRVVISTRIEMDDLDRAVRLRAFQFLTEQTSVHGDVLPWGVLSQGFLWEGRRVPPGRWIMLPRCRVAVLASRNRIPPGLQQPSRPRLRLSKFPWWHRLLIDPQATAFPSRRRFKFCQLLVARILPVPPRHPVANQGLIEARPIRQPHLA